MRHVFIAVAIILVSSLQVRAQWTQGTNVITTTNSVGIGTTTPGVSLDVFKANSNDPIARFGNLNNASSQSIWISNGANLQTKVFIAGGTGAFFTGTQQGDGGMQVPSGKSLFLGDGFTNPTMVLKGGSVGIGTLSPGTFKLAVEGTLGARKVVVTQTNPWPDYVFDSAYKLQPLADVEQFVKEKKHLPEVPTTSDVQKEGLDLGTSQTLLLKKIEELTLYVIEQKKEIEELQKKVESLENSSK